MDHTFKICPQYKEERKEFYRITPISAVERLLCSISDVIPFMGIVGNMFQ